MKPRSYVVHVEAGPSGERAWCEAVRRAHLASAALVAIRVMPRPSRLLRRHRAAVQRSASLHVQAWRELAARAEAVAGAVDVEIVVVERDPATEIARAARQHESELIVLGPASVDDELFGSEHCRATSLETATFGLTGTVGGFSVGSVDLQVGMRARCASRGLVASPNGAGYQKSRSMVTSLTA